MPIRPEFRKYYQRDWKAYRLALIQLMGNRCSACRAVLPSHRLAGAHVRHDPRDWSQVAIMCFACHTRHDSAQRLSVWRRNRAARAGQLWLWPEVEYAPFPSWVIPRSVIRAAQSTMFP